MTGAGVPGIIVIDINFNVIAIGEVSHDKPDDGYYQLLGAMLRVYLETGLLPYGILLAKKSISLITHAYYQWHNS
uniref:Uncharacterized protein n=1 Tax=Amphimedon queenslandica TaxID=400682 RepID=A0A1X7VS38_AMPQE